MPADVAWDDAWAPPPGDPLATHRADSWWIELLTRDERPAGRLRGVTGGSIDADASAPVQRGGRLDVTDVGQGVTWLDARVRVWWQVEGVDPWPLGTFLCAAPTERHTATTSGWAVDLIDKVAILSRSKARTTVSLTAGTNVITAVRAQIDAATSGAATAITDSEQTLPTALSWPAGTDRLTIINDLLGGINYDPIRTNELGVYVAAPNVAPDARPIARTLAAGPGTGIHLPEFTVDADLDAIPNVVVMVSRGTGDLPAMVAVAVNDDPTSPFSTLARGFEIVDFTDGVEAADRDVLGALAARRLAETSQVHRAATVPVAPIPLDLGDVLRFEPSTAAPMTATVEKWTQRLALGATLSVTMKAVTA